MQVGDRVHICPGGASFFTIAEISEDDGRCLIEPVDDDPGKYPFLGEPEDLIPEA